MSVTTKVTGGEVIEILDDNKEDVMNENEQEEVHVKIDPEQLDGAQHTTVRASKQGDSRRSGQTRIANIRFEDYELYVTMEEEEL